MIVAASSRRTLFLTRVPKGTGRFLMRRLASLIYITLSKKKELLCDRCFKTELMNSCSTS
jgi:hypothetical protein